MDHPSFIQFYPTLRCNQECVFCFNRGISDPSSYGDMSMEGAFALSDILLRTGVREIDILGGEPLLVSWMPDFVRRLTDLGMTLYMSTNGGLTEVIHRLSELRGDRMNLGFSLHGLSRTHNAMTRSDNFPKAAAGIKMLVEAGKDPIVKSALTRANMSEIYDLIDYLKALGVKRYFLLHEDIIGRQDFSSCFSYPEFREFYNRLGEISTEKFRIDFVAASGFYRYGDKTVGRCDAGVNKLAIMPDGSTFPCNLFSGFKEFLLGNIFRDGIDKIWESPVLEYFRKFARENPCGRYDCEHRPGCSGGCPAHSYLFYGTLNATDPRCAGQKG